MNRVRRAATARRLVSHQTAVVHRLASLLLAYPTSDLIALLPVLRAASLELPGRDREPFTELFDHLGARPLVDLQAEYVETFDLRRRCSPYLTYYAYGDTRKRGVALVEFKQAYRRAGFEMTGDAGSAELPDHLGVVLEFCSSDDAEAQEAGIGLLLAHRAGLELLRLALADAGSPYASVLVAVCATLPPLAGEDRAAVAKLAAEGPPDEDVGLEPFAPPSYMPAARHPVPLPIPGART